MQARSRSQFLNLSLLLPVSVLLLLSMFCANWLRPGAYMNARAAGLTATIGGCLLFPANNIWNYDISNLPVHPNSANFIASIGLTGHLHPDFGAGLYNGGPIGFPYIVVPGSQPYVPVSFDYAGESDPGPYPIPANAPIEGGSQSSGDRHVLVVDSATCKLYEMYDSYPQQNGSWHASSGAVWNLNSNALRPATWTSADAAGLPILPGLANYDEVASGAITHALRFTVSQTQDTFLWPARHQASSSSNPNLPPMGLRLRLKASVNISSFSHTNQIILTALKHYGMFVADNGSNWYISGTSDNRWSNDDLHALSAIPGSDFEVVDESALQLSANSAQVKGSPTFSPSPTVAVFPTHSPTRSPTTGATITPTPRIGRAQETSDAPHPPPGSSKTALATPGNAGIGSFFPFVLGSIIVLLCLTLVFLRVKRSRSSLR